MFWNDGLERMFRIGCLTGHRFCLEYPRVFLLAVPKNVRIKTKFFPAKLLWPQSQLLYRHHICLAFLFEKVAINATIYCIKRLAAIIGNMYLKNL